jgi:hypothetical protein
VAGISRDRTVGVSAPTVRSSDKEKPMRSKITTGEVPVSLDDDELILRPTLRAMTQLSRTYGGLAKVRAELVAENIDAIATVLRLGAGMSDRDAKDLG